MRYNPRMIFSAFLFLLFGAAQTVPAVCPPGWQGEYEWGESTPHPGGEVTMVWDYSISIGEENGRCQASIEGDGFQMMRRIVADVEGDANEIRLLYREMGPDAGFGSAGEPGELLFRLKREGQDIITHWEKMRPQLEQHEAPGIYFKRSKAEPAPQEESSEKPSAVKASPNPAGLSRFGFDGFLLGAFIDGQWVSNEDLQENERYHLHRIWGGEEGRVYRFGGLETDSAVVTADAMDHREDDPDDKNRGPEFHTMSVQTGPDQSRGRGDARLTIIGDFDAMPRKAQVLPPDNPIYREIVAAWLAERGLPGAEPKITQIIRVDLDGNGKDEVLIAAQNIVYPDDGAQAELFSFEQDTPLLTELKNPNGVGPLARAGQYSILLLRKVKNEQAHNIPIAEFIATKDSPENEDPLTSSNTPSVHKIAGIADLNGDGVMEILTAEAFFSGLWYRVYEMRGQDVCKILENGISGD